MLRIGLNVGRYWPFVVWQFVRLNPCAPGLSRFACETERSRLWGVTSSNGAPARRVCTPHWPRSLRARPTTARITQSRPVSHHVLLHRPRYADRLRLFVVSVGLGPIFTLPPGKGAKQCDERVCMSVCLSACISQKQHVQTSRNLLYRYVLSVVVLWRHCNTLGYVLPILWMTLCLP